MKVCVIGAGLFGCLTALKLAARGIAVDLIEKSADILQGASKHNHNRIHLGYHYLRSVETAQDSIEGLQSFKELFGEAINSEFPNYYCIAAQDSKTTPERFEEFCDIVGIPHRVEFPSADLLDRSMLSQCYRVPEPVWDYFAVRRVLGKLLQESSVEVMLNTDVVSAALQHEGYAVRTSRWTGEHHYHALVNASYSNINHINALVGAPKRTYLYEDVCIPIFRYPSEIFGLTVMDGEFCSVMPRAGCPNEWLLYHVKHSILARQLGASGLTGSSDVAHHDFMFEESARFMPFLRNMKSFDQYRCTRIVWENQDDARRSMLYQDLPNYYSILSGKVTTCVDVGERVSALIAASQS